jgi:hypothetical protein|mmetsp:Transcript_1776/g.2802  ORF Transcript_1776/g.2802 Transcript_1776/m.2802 type:complete len:88 (-) Transcript_1776:14-277(-)
MTELADIWRDIHYPSFAAAFAAELPDISPEALITVGERLQLVAVALGAEAHPFSEDHAVGSGWAVEWKTVIHGDPKAERPWTPNPRP